MWIQASPSCRLADIKYAEQLGYRIAAGHHNVRLLALSCALTPTLVPQRRLIATVEGAMNAVMVQGDAVAPPCTHGSRNLSPPFRLWCG